jgi:hypothetical protein
MTAGNGGDFGQHTRLEQADLLRSFDNPAVAEVQA